MLRKAFSLRRNLLVTFLALWLISAVIATFAAYALAGKAAQISFDRILKDDALAIAAQLKWEPTGATFPLDTNTAELLIFDSTSPSQFGIFNKDHKKIAGDSNLNLEIDFTQIKNGDPLFFDITPDHASMRVVVLKIDHVNRDDWVWVVVVESNDKRQKISHELAAAIFLPAVGLAFLMIPLLLAGIKYGLSPAYVISEAVSHKNIDDLSPLPLDGVPEELLVLMVRVNELLSRLQNSVEHERRFISDAAHQLRTPIAGIKLLTEDLVRTHQANAHQPPDDEVLKELSAASTRAAHLVRQLLSLARADQVMRGDNAFDFESLLLKVFGQWQKSVLASHKQLVWGAHVASMKPISLHGNPILLDEALGNLIDNAIQYGGSVIELDANTIQGDLLIHVTDNGVGVDPNDIDWMLTPFWRGPNTGSVGVGLGLPIAVKAIHHLGGQLSIQSRPLIEGTRITIRIPANVVA